MGRSPCCEKVGLKRGSWSQEEDQILITYIQQHGHPNWRALPKRAGLLRCGKSCRLRWTNYLRPDIKRGNFTKEEEDTIIHLHEMLGNRWSIIATKVPGRTDNEIKNVWHTRLKKRTENHQTTIKGSKKRHKKSKCASKASYVEESIVSQGLIEQKHKSLDQKEFVSTIQPSSSESSSVTDLAMNSDSIAKHDKINHKMFLDDSFWQETLLGKGDDFMETEAQTNKPCVDLPTVSPSCSEIAPTTNPNIDGNIEDMYLWYDIFTRIEELPELPDF